MNQDEELKAMFGDETKDVIEHDPAPPPAKIEAPKDEKLDTDFEYARDNMYQAMEMQNEAMAEMLEVAKASGHQRAFEVFGSMFSQFTDAQVKLMGIHQQKSKIEQTEGKMPTTTNIQQNLVVGTTKDLLRMVKEK